MRSDNPGGPAEGPTADTTLIGRRSLHPPQPEAAALQYRKHPNRPPHPQSAWGLAAFLAVASLFPPHRPRASSFSSLRPSATAAAGSTFRSRSVGPPCPVRWCHLPELPSTDACAFGATTRASGPAGGGHAWRQEARLRRGAGNTGQVRLRGRTPGPARPHNRMKRAVRHHPVPVDRIGKGVRRRMRGRTGRRRGRRTRTSAGPRSRNGVGAPGSAHADGMTRRIRR